MSNSSQLTRLRQVRYSASVADKDAAEFDSSKCIRRTPASWRLFFVRNASVCPFQWAAVVGSLRAAGTRVHRSVNPAICRPPRLTERRGVTLAHGDAYVW